MSELSGDRAIERQADAFSFKGPRPANPDAFGRAVCEYLEVPPDQVTSVQLMQAANEGHTTAILTFTVSADGVLLIAEYLKGWACSPDRDDGCRWTRP